MLRCVNRRFVVFAVVLDILSQRIFIIIALGAAPSLVPHWHNCSTCEERKDVSSTSARGTGGLEEGVALSTSVARCWAGKRRRGETRNNLMSHGISTERTIPYPLAL